MVLTNKMKKNLPPIIPIKDDPELGTLSKAEAQAKWRREKEIRKRLALEESRIRTEIKEEIKSEPVETESIEKEGIDKTRRPGRPRRAE